MGALDIDAVDIDPEAVKATLDNAQTNEVDIHAGLPDLAHGKYNLVVANILATPLKVLAPLLCGHIAPAGQLILAGILSRQADELVEAYAPYVALSILDEEDGWILMGATQSQ
jgi:ribosomal protein L11 methyltransferase